jgi:hypothetical protein
MGQRRLREDIPIHLSFSYKDAAVHLRNKLLLFRFRTLHKREAVASFVDRAIEPRLNQVFVSLLSIISDPRAQEDIRELARRYNRELVTERSMDVEAQILEIIRDTCASPLQPRLTIKEIASWFADRHGDDYERTITTKWIGGIIRKKLNVKTQKSHGVFVISPVEKPKLDRLYEKYGLSPQEGSEADTEESSQSSAFAPRVDANHYPHLVHLGKACEGAYT